MLVGLAWPMVISGQLSVLISLIMIFWVARLVGAPGLAVVGVMSPLETAANWCLAMVAMGYGSMLSREVGGGRTGGTTLLFNALVLTIGVGTVLALTGAVAFDSLAGVIGSEATAGLPTYLAVTLVSLPFIAVSHVLLETVIATGWTRFGLARTVIDLVLFAALVPALVALGMGVAGAAAASLLSTIVLDVWTMFAIRAGRQQLGLVALDRSTARLRPGLWREMARVGGPVQLGRVAGFVAEALVVQLVVRRSPDAAPGFALALQVSLIPPMVTFALARAHGIVTGHSVGAGMSARAIGSLHSAVTLGVVVGGAFAVLAWQAEPLLRIFTSDEHIVDTAATTVRLLAFGFAPMAVTQILVATATACGRSIVSSGVVLVTADLLGLGLAWMLVERGFASERAVPLAVVITDVIKAVALWVLVPRTVGTS